MTQPNSPAGWYPSPVRRRVRQPGVTRRKGLTVATVLVAVVVAILLLLSRCSTASSIAGRGSTGSIVGDWRVTYGAPAVVTIAGSQAGYAMRSKTPLRVTTASCDLPPGTLIATFAADGADSYTGHHGLWNVSNCTFAQQTNVTLTLHRDGHLSELLGNGERYNLTRA